MKKIYKHKTNLQALDTYLLDDIGDFDEIEYDLDELMKIYEDMLIIRKMEEQSQILYEKGEIRGFCHLVTGQESIYAAYKMSRHEKDTCTSSYRCHGLSYVTGDKPKYILAELLGRKNGICGGKGGSMHLYNNNFFGGHGIVGASVPIGVGVAFKHKYQNMQKGDTFDKMNAENVNFTFYGDGAANQGQIFEVFNMAAIWKLPVVFVCENNQYGMWTQVQKVSHETNFYKRGLNLPGIRISHDNIFDLIAVMKFCNEFVLKKQPILLEINTYRICTHSARDAKDFRKNSELNKKQDEDVIKKYRNFLKTFMNEIEICKLEQKVNVEIENAITYALSSPEPSYEDLHTNVIIE